MSSPRAHVPWRRCVACGLRGPRAEFVRFALEAGHDPPRVVVDAEGPRWGRGAYVCRRRVCFEQALRRRAFPRAFRRTVTVEPEKLRAEFEAVVEEAT